ncbi:MAG: YceI family protein [Bradymonadaceae bacterium]
MMRSFERSFVVGLLALGALLVGVPATTVAQSDKGASGTETYKLDPVHSQILLRASHMDIGLYFVQIPQVTGTIEYNKDDPTKNSVTIEADATTIESHYKKRTKHLKSPDFLNVKKYPTLTFESTSVEKVGENTFEVSGDLTVAGTTKPITIDVEEVGSGKGPDGNLRRGFYTEFEVNRLDFGVDWKPSVVGKNIRVILAFEAVRQ